MRNSNYIVVCIFVACFSYSVHTNGQTKNEIAEIQRGTNVNELLSLSRKYREEEDNNKKKALYYAKINGWKIRHITKDNVYAELQRVTEDLKPIYYYTTNEGAGITSRANKLYSGGGLNLNVQGQNMTAGVWDAGALRLSHELFQGRAVQKDGATTHHSHAQHVTGTIIGGSGFQGGKAKGMAFQGNAQAYDWNNDVSETAAAAANGLLISNHSYHAGVGGTYDYGAFNWDTIMYNAPYYLMVFAAGNNGANTNIISNYASNKNGIAVAAVEELRNYTGPSSVVAAYFTSRGPTDDFRIKPDISAKGVNTYSSTVDSNNSYDYYSGTSMASPSTTGTLLLLQQHYKNINGAFMKSSSLRNLSIHTADEAGPNPGPDTTFGWGLLNAEKAAKVISNSNNTSIISENTLATGGSYTRQLVASGTEPLVVSICWTDPAGAIAPDNTTAARLVNDLDLRVTSNGNTYYPWKLNQSNVTGPALKGDNDRDNIEKIEIPNVAPNQVYTITVSHKGSLRNSKQDYSLIVTGVKNTSCLLDISVTSNVTSGVSKEQASISVTASNNISDGATAIYHAGSEVVLKNGFVASKGSVFRGYIEDCTGSYASKQLVSPEREVIVYGAQPEIITETWNINNSIEIYPNPNKGKFSIKINDKNIESFFLSIFDSTGKEVVKKTSYSSNIVPVNITDQLPGVYILKITAENGINLSKKIMKE